MISIPILPNVNRHIGSTLVLGFVLLAVVPVATVLTFALGQADEQAHLQAVAQLESVASIKFGEAERWLRDQGTILDLLLTDPLKRPAVELFQGQNQAESVNRLLRAYLQQQHTFSEFFLYDTKGQVIASTFPVQQGKIVFDQPYFSPSLAGDYIQSPFYEVSAGELNMILTRPIHDTNGTVIGVMAGRLNMDELSQIMTERAGLGATGETYLVSLESNYLVTASRFDNYPLTRAYHSQGIDEALAGHDGSSIYLNYRDTSTIGVYRWIPEMQSALLAEMSESESLTTLYQIRRVSEIAGVIIAMVAAIIGIAITLHITRPIVALTQVANQVAGGNYTLRVRVSRRDEIGQLGNAFNTMTEQLTHTIAELNRRIEEINHINQELSIATAQAQEALRAKDAFLAVMSHELRTPLNAIIGFAEVLQIRIHPDERVKHIFERIKSNSDRLLTLVNNVLDISRIASGKLQLRDETLDLHQLINELCGQMEILAEKKGLTFKIEIDNSLHEIVSSREALTKIISNLLSNAFKFTTQGDVSLKASQQEAKLKLEVSDTGIGIPNNMHEAVFETFRQVDNAATKRTYGGSGLGLAIVRELCAALGGLVTLTSAPGLGSTFTVILPLKSHSNMEVAVL